MFTWFGRMIRRQQMREQLSRMTQRELKDMGIGYGDIARIVASVR